MKGEIGINDVMNAIVETANAMCNPDEWKFEWDILEPGNLVLNCRRVGGFRCVEDVENAIGYCRDAAAVAERNLVLLDGDEWYCHSEENVWMENGDELDGWLYDNNEAKHVSCVQCQFFND